MLNPKPIIIAVCCAVAIVVGVYLVGQYALVQNNPDDIPVTSTTGQKPGPTAKGHWHGDVWHDETAADSEPKPGPTETKGDINEGVLHDEAVTSDDIANTNDADDDGLVERFLPDGTLVPKHLRLPKKWVGFGTSDITHEDMEILHEIHNWLHDVIREVAANYNPNRPLAEVWPLFMAAEKEYLLKSKDVDEPYYLGIGAGQAEFIYNQIWDYPEVLALSHSEGLDGLHTRVHRVEIGTLDPDWNYVELPDGRDFYVKHGYEYTFNYAHDEEFGGPLGGFTISFTSNPTNITIDLDTATDADLERIGGWNYNFNPYTNQPIVRY